MINTIVLRQGVVDDITIRLIVEECWVKEQSGNFKPAMILSSRTYKVQVKNTGISRLFNRYVTIKNFLGSKFSEEDNEFAYNEANELFNNIVNPYKYNG